MYIIFILLYIKTQLFENKNLRKGQIKKLKTNLLTSNAEMNLTWVYFSKGLVTDAHEITDIFIEFWAFSFIYPGATDIPAQPFSTILGIITFLVFFVFYLS